MAAITEPIILDSTGQGMITALNGIASALTPQDTIKANSVYPVETSPSEHAYSEGDHLIVDGVTYIAIDDIAIGDSLVLNTNIEAETLAARMNHIEDGIESASTAAGTAYDSNTSVKEKIDSVNTDLTNHTPISLGTVTGNTTKNVQFPAQSSGMFFFLGAEQELVGEAIAHAWSSDRLMRFIGTQPTKVGIVTGPQAFAVTNSSGNSLLVYYQRIRGDMPYMV